MANTYTFEHPTLGSLTGAIIPECDTVVQFKAIPYAILPRRFEHSILLESFDGISRDFTKPGFACPHSFQKDDIHSGGPYPGAEPIETSEFESLILQINVPLSILKAHKSNSSTAPSRLPVMTYIHGGAFVLGKIDAHHNTAFIVQKSIEDEQPVIACSMQYRLGALGFLAIPDGGKNFALYDQRNAFLWIQKFIDGFGGDKHQVTAFGESAGGYSICLHMLSDPSPSGPLFKRAIIMSGIIGSLVTPLRQTDADNAFEKILKILNIQKRGPDALDTLRSLSVEDLVSANDTYISRGNSWRPVEDGSWSSDRLVTWDRIPELLYQCDWVDDLIVGNTGFEGTAFTSAMNKITPQRFQELAGKDLSEEATKKVMQAYDVDSDMDQNRLSTSLMRWVGDICFDASIHATASYLSVNPSKRVFRYIFDVRNPFPGAPLYQQAHHWVDVYFLFRALQFRFAHQYLKDISDKHAQLWTDFAYGKAPWTEYKDDSKIVMVADERDGWVERTQEEHERLTTYDFGRLEKLWDSWTEKKGTNFLPLDMRMLSEETQ